MAERLRAGGRIALLILALTLPFEMKAPLVRIGPLELSSAELFLYLALAVWGASLVGAWVAGERALVPGLRRLPAAYRAVLCLAIVVVVSAMAAGAPRAPGIKFALRSLGGMLLFAATADLLSARGAVARTAAALVAGAFAAALLAIAEVRLAAAGALLRPFHEQTFQALGSPRGSGPFQYPNIAAMYLEATAPLAVALGLDRLGERGGSAPQRGPRIAVVAFITFVLLGGVLATASRAGLLGALVAVLLVSLVGSRSPARRPMAWAGMVAAVTVMALASTSALSGRFRFWKDGEWYRAVIARSDADGRGSPAAVEPAGEISESLDVQNQGQLRWRRGAPTAVTVSYHWLDAQGAMVTFDGVRTSLPADVDPGGRAFVRAVARAPSRPGRYVLWWDLVHEQTTWFSERGNPGLREEVEVRSGAPAVLSVAAPRLPLAPPIHEQTTVARKDLWEAALKLFLARPLTGIGPDNFRHRSAAVLKLAPDDFDERLHANSLYFETLADLGVMGILAFALVVAALGAAARRSLAALPTSLVALGLAAALGTYLLHGVLDYFLEFTPTYAQFWMLAGMMVALGTEAEAAV